VAGVLLIGTLLASHRLSMTFNDNNNIIQGLIRAVFVYRHPLSLPSIRLVTFLVAQFLCCRGFYSHAQHSLPQAGVLLIGQNVACVLHIGMLLASTGSCPSYRPECGACSSYRHALNLPQAHAFVVEMVVLFYIVLKNVVVCPSYRHPC
jgi:hypothetical protein